ncbi:hypothetical protein B4U80_06126 [Leptotrombidium deliense]|uniref:Uncharacterized protein n=1 Tax=Leptotrombidium deliense TaxID=299467 RepID=A0A443S879_9ACAR|nr:hypothetical protein B4U80_06126 [Leptotrombidium deliense]
MLIVYYVNI